MPVVQVNSWTAEIASAKHLTTCIHTVDATKHICTARSTAGLWFFFCRVKVKVIDRMDIPFTSSNGKSLHPTKCAVLTVILSCSRFEQIKDMTDSCCMHAYTDEKVWTGAKSDLLWLELLTAVMRSGLPQVSRVFTISVNQHVHTCDNKKPL